MKYCIEISLNIQAQRSMGEASLPKPHKRPSSSQLGAAPCGFYLLAKTHVWLSFPGPGHLAVGVKYSFQQGSKALGCSFPSPQIGGQAGGLERQRLLSCFWSPRLMAEAKMDIICFSTAVPTQPVGVASSFWQGRGRTGCDIWDPNEGLLL